MPIDYQRLMGWPIPEVRQSYGPRDAILYALGVGCGGEADPALDLRYVYEDGLVALPSMATILGYPGFWMRDPGTGVNWRRAHAWRASIRDPATAGDAGCHHRTLTRGRPRR